MAHHLGRWRLNEDMGAPKIASAVVSIEEKETGKFTMRQLHGVKPYKSDDPDTGRIWWKEVGVNQNLTFPVQADPISGMHCWHQKVRVKRTEAEDRFGDVFVDTSKSREVFEEWLRMTKPAPGPDGTRRPLWLNRPLHPSADAYRVDGN